MKCPFCKTKLVAGKDKKYETLTDHVFDPNNTDRPYRKTFVCPNPNCKIGEGSFWSEDGSWYIGNCNIEDYKNIIKLNCTSSLS